MTNRSEPSRFTPEQVAPPRKKMTPLREKNGGLQQQEYLEVFRPIKTNKTKKTENKSKKNGKKTQKKLQPVSVRLFKDV